MQSLRNCNGPTIYIGREILCLPYAGFFTVNVRLYQSVTISQCEAVSVCNYKPVSVCLSLGCASAGSAQWGSVEGAPGLPQSPSTLGSAYSLPCLSLSQPLVVTTASLDWGTFSSSCDYSLPGLKQFQSLVLTKLSLDSGTFSPEVWLQFPLTEVQSVLSRDYSFQG